MNQFNVIMSRPNQHILKQLGQINIQVPKLPPLLKLLVPIKNFFCGRRTLGTGKIANFNSVLNRTLSKLRQLNQSIDSLSVDEALYEAFHKDIYLDMCGLFADLEKDSFLYCDETEMIANNIMKEVFNIEFSLRKKAFSVDYKPNHEEDKKLMEYASLVSLTSSISHLKENESSTAI